MRNLVSVAIIIGGTFLCGVVAYFLATELTGSALSKATDGMAFSRWKEKFLTLVILTGGFTGICSLAWFVSCLFFKISSPSGVGRRTIWAVLGAVTLLGSIAIPQIYSAVTGIKVNAVVTAIFVVEFTLLGYWGVSLFSTPAAFKYTPLGAQLVRSRK